MQVRTWTYGPAHPPLLAVATGGELLAELWGVLSGYYHRVNFELLPPGWWPKGKNPEAQVSEELILRQVMLLPERFDFLRGLFPSQEVIGLKGRGLGSAYRAFVLGERVLVDCELEGNALYVFRNGDAWQRLIRMPKIEIVRGGHPDFLGRVVHKGDWQKRVLEKMS